jgi:hypothetical protein
MTEQEWLECTNPEYMMPALRGKSSNRKLRLLVVAVCQKVRHLMVGEESRRAVQVAERFAVGKASEEERAEAEASARRALTAAFERWDADEGAEVPPAGVGYWAAKAAAGAVTSTAYEGAEKAVSAAGMALAWYEDESLVAGPNYWGGIELSGPWPQIIHDIFGNPFRPVSVDPSWLSWKDGTIPKLAEAIYQERAFDRLQVLADALEEAGCTEAAILAHCRGPGPHVRGCWPVDLLLGKA